MRNQNQGPVLALVLVVGYLSIVESTVSAMSGQNSDRDRVIISNNIRNIDPATDLVNKYSDSNPNEGDLRSQSSKGTNSGSGSGTGPSKPRPSSSPFTNRLPKNVVPTSYTVKIQPILEPSYDFAQWSAPGEVTISFSIVENTDAVVLHAANMSIMQSNVKLLKKDSNEVVGVKSQLQDQKDDTFTVMTDKEMMKGENYEITIPFVAGLLGKNVGLYGFMYPDPDPAPYSGDQGPEGNAAEPRMRRAAASQFQPYHARSAFPCFDEPHLKARFEISIGRLETYQSFSNTKIKETMADPVSKGWVWDIYETTPVMSTNVVNFVVVDGYTSDVADASINPNTKIQVWAPKLLIDQNAAKYSVNQTAHIFKFFEDYFGVPYPLDKLDSILVWQTDGPAMEHWGSITYGLGGAALLYSPGTTAEWKRLSIVSLLAHEVLHQWMGNLVSVDWWSDIWLHEGFADYFADMAVAHLQPEFQSTKLLVNSHFQRALRADQSEHNHPVKCIFNMPEAQNKDGHPPGDGGSDSDHDEDDDLGSFDDIVYSKGASLVRMMNLFLTEPVFKEGIRAFIKNFAYKAVSQDDLFDSMNGVIPTNTLPEGVTLKQIMDTWTLQAGYPVVTVMPVGDSTLRLSQEKFKTRKPEDNGHNHNHGDGKSSQSHTHWWIPVKIATSNNPATPEFPQVWMPQSAHELNYSSNVDTSKWLIVNPDATGYFRVLYDLSIQDRIKAQLDMDHTVFSPVTRSQLLDDYFTFAAFDYVPIEEALELTTYLGKEKELVVWDVVFAHLSTAINMFSSNAEFDGLQKYLIPKIDAVLLSPELNLEKDPEDKGAVVLFQMELLKYGCMLQSPTCHKYVSSVINTWMAMEQTNPIPLDLQPTMYCAGIAGGDKKVWDFMKKIHDQLPPSEQKMIIFKALTCSKDAAVLGLMLEENWLKENMISPIQTLEAMADNPMGKFLVFEFLKANMGKMMPENFVRILDMLSEYWVDPEQISDLENFVKANPDFFASQKDEINDEIESHKENAAWMNNLGKRMDVWFNSNSIANEGKVEM